MLTDILRYVVTHWETAFFLTLTIEVPIYMYMTKGRVPLWRSALAGVACSAITHPLLWFAWRHVVHDYMDYVISGEILVAIIESGVFFAIARPVRPLHAVAASCVANGASYGTGLLLWQFLKFLH
ncbi:MAG: hypothetical protein GY854_22300 [Deltaproteobacteria bacterium]|nr:hypothetical protein [Deltaproteobacteria bacterium]